MNLIGIFNDYNLPGRQPAGFSAKESFFASLRNEGAKIKASNDPPPEQRYAFQNEDGSFVGSKIDLKGQTISAYLKGLSGEDFKGKNLSAVNRAELLRLLAADGTLSNEERVSFLIDLFKDYNVPGKCSSRTVNKVEAFYTANNAQLMAWRREWRNAPDERRQEILNELQQKFSKWMKFDSVAISYAQDSYNDTHFMALEERAANKNEKKGGDDGQQPLPPFRKGYYDRRHNFINIDPRTGNFDNAAGTLIHESNHGFQRQMLDEFKTNYAPGSEAKFDPNDDHMKHMLILYATRLSCPRTQDDMYVSSNEGIEYHRKKNPKDKKDLVDQGVKYHYKNPAEEEAEDAAGAYYRKVREERDQIEATQKDEIEQRIKRDSGNQHSLWARP